MVKKVLAIIIILSALLLISCRSKSNEEEKNIPILDSSKEYSDTCIIPQTQEQQEALVKYVYPLCGDVRTLRDSWYRGTDLDRANYISFCAYNNLVKKEPDTPNTVSPRPEEYVNEYIEAEQVENAIKEYFVFDIPIDFLRSSSMYEYNPPDNQSTDNMSVKGKYLMQKIFMDPGYINILNMVQEDDILYIYISLHSDKSRIYLPDTISVLAIQLNGETFKYISNTAYRINEIYDVQ